MKKPIALQVTEFLQTSYPVDGVSIGRKSDRSTWRIDFSPTATAQQKKDAISSLKNFTSSDDDIKTEFDALKDRVAALETSAKI